MGELSACVALSWPLILTNAIEMAMNLTSVAMIGRVSPDALAASTLALSLHNLFLLFGVGVVAAVPSLLSRQLGRDETDRTAVRRIVQQGFWGVLIITGPICLVLWNAEAILVALGQDPALSAAAEHYLHALQWSIPPALLYLVLRSLFATLGHPRWAVVIGAMAIILNALLNWLLIGGHGGLPALGLFGSGLATVLANVFMAAALGAIACLDPRLRCFRIFARVHRPQWAGFGAFWRVGLPIGVSLLLEAGMFSGAAGVVGLFDAASLAAHAIALQVASFIFMIPLGLAQAATIRIGRASGAGDGAGIKRAGWVALSLAIGVMLVSAAVLVATPRAIVGLFLDRGETGFATVEEIAVTLLGLAGLFQIADGAQVVLAGMLRGLQDTRVPMLIAALGYWGVGLPLGAALAVWADLRATGVWIGLAVGLFAVAGLLLARWMRMVRRTLSPRIIETKQGMQLVA